MPQAVLSVNYQVFLLLVACIRAGLVALLDIVSGSLISLLGVVSGSLITLLDVIPVGRRGFGSGGFRSVCLWCICRLCGVCRVTLRNAYPGMSRSGHAGGSRPAGRVSESDTRGSGQQQGRGNQEQSFLCVHVWLPPREFSTFIRPIHMRRSLYLSHCMRAK